MEKKVLIELYELPGTYYFPRLNIYTKIFHIQNKITGLNSLAMFWPKQVWL